jgi:hypothetical protein
MVKTALINKHNYGSYLAMKTRLCSNVARFDKQSAPGGPEKFQVGECV